MRAWVYDSVSGGLETHLKLDPDAPSRPALGPNDILVKVQFMSPNPADFKFPEGLGLLWRLAVSLPAVPGSDFSGTVAGLGDGIKASGELAVGQAVFGTVKLPTRFGSLGEYIITTRDGCAPAPAGVSLEQACCLGVAAQTAWQSIAPFVVAGDRVFINGGSGGCGTFGIQIAKALGCRVVVSCSGRNVELCKSLGADEVIDYTKEDVSAVLRRKGAVFKLSVDNVGADPPDLFKAADEYLMKDGQFVQVGAGLSFKQISTITSRALRPGFLGGGRRKWKFMGLASKHDDLVKISKLAAEGKIKAVIEETYQYQDAPKAYAKMRTGRTRGCIVVKH